MFDIDRVKEGGVLGLPDVPQARDRPLQPGEPADARCAVGLYSLLSGTRREPFATM